jgi:lysophospholipase L1-like esterase
LAAAIAVLVGVGALLVALIAQRRWLRARELGKGLLISYCTIALMLAAGELYFRFVHADSEGRLASNNWMSRYWRENSLGYRDREWTEADWRGKTVVAVTGDSFAAGWGVENPADRFPDVLASRLGDDYAVFNLGVAGTSTPHQLESLGTLPVQPDVVIFQYFLNDIDYAAMTLGIPIPMEQPTALERESHLANFISARFRAGFNADYWQQQYSFFNSPPVWEAHAAHLNAYIDAVERLNARLIVVIFPNLLDPVGSIAYVDRVAQVFEARGQTEILKLFDAAASLPQAQIIVSPRDSHPSAAFHRLVGEMLYARFFAAGAS